MERIRSLIASVALLALAGCAGMGPIQEPGWQDKVAIALPAHDRTVELQSPAAWFPDIQGYAQNPGLSLMGPDFHNGVLALTPKSITFLQWAKTGELYRIEYRAEYADIAAARIESYGRGRRIVITTRDYRSQTFELSGPHGAMANRADTERAAALISARAPNP